MLGVQPRSPSAEPAPCWTRQPGSPSPAKRRRLHQPTAPEPTPGLHESVWPASAVLPSTSMVLMATGCALQLTVGGVDLLLQPDPTSLLQVSLQGHTIVLVPEGLLNCAHLSPGQPGRAPDGPQLASQDQQVLIVEEEFWESVPDIAGQEVAYEQDVDPGILEASQDQQVLIVEEEFWESAPDIAGQEVAYEQDVDPGILEASQDQQVLIVEEEFWESVPDIAGQEVADPGILAPWMDAAAGLDVGLLHSTGASMPGPPESSSGAESDAPQPPWDHCMLRPFPGSPLQPLPPSPLPSPQELFLPHSPRPQSKVRRRLFHE